jgi:hypothetical protein
MDVPHLVRGEHRLVVLDQVRFIRPWDVAMIDHHEL